MKQKNGKKRGKKRSENETKILIFSFWSLFTAFFRFLENKKKTNETKKWKKNEKKWRKNKNNFVFFILVTF